MEKINIDQEVLVKCKVEEIHHTKEGKEYRLIPLSANSFVQEFNAQECDIVTCSHCCYDSNLMCKECEEKEARSLGAYRLGGHL